MDEYGNWIYLTPMVLGGAATMLAAAWKFLGLGSRAAEGPLDLSTPWRAGFGKSIQRLNFRISKTKSTAF